MTTCAILLFPCLLLPFLPNLSQAYIHVRDFGAFPDDDIDDTWAIREAFDAINKDGDTVEFDVGEYLVANHLEDAEDSNDGPLFTLSGYSNLLIEGNGALLNGGGKSPDAWSTVFFLRNMDNFVMKNIQIDWEYNLPFSTGFVLEQGNIEIEGQEDEYSYVDIEVNFPHKPLRPGLPAKAFLQYDPERKRPSIDGVDEFNTSSKYNPPCDILTPDILRCYKADPSIDTPVGTYMIVRHGLYDRNAVEIWDSDNVKLHGVTVYAAAGAGVFTWAVADLLVDRLRIEPRTAERWMSTSVDGVHIKSNRGTLMVTNSYFEGLGDDAFNSRNDYMQLQQAPSGRSIRIGQAGDTPEIADRAIPKVGDILEFASTGSTNGNSFEPKIQVTVMEIQGNENGIIDILVDKELPASIESNAYVINLSDAPKQTIVRNTQFFKNRARGMLLMNRNVLVEDCLFEDITGPAILLAVEDYFYEGNPARNVWIHRSTFRNNNYGAAQKGGTITAFARRDGSIANSHLYRNITIVNNEFVITDNHYALWLASADRVTFRENILSEELTYPVFLHDTAGSDMDIDVLVAKGAETVASYSNDFTGPEPMSGWQYLWNRDGPMGDASNYASLFWNAEMKIYDVNGDNEYPNPGTDLVYGFLADDAGHPGSSSTQGETYSRFVIAAYTVDADGPYAIQDSAFEAYDESCGDGNDFRVYVNDDLLFERHVANGKSFDFDMTFGLLNAGATIYVAVGPSGSDSCDYFELEFDISTADVLLQPQTVQAPNHDCPETSNKQVSFTRKRLFGTQTKTVNCTWLVERVGRARKRCQNPLADDPDARVEDVCVQQCGRCQG